MYNKDQGNKVIISFVIFTIFFIVTLLFIFLFLKFQQPKKGKVKAHLSLNETRNQKKHERGKKNNLSQKILLGFFILYIILYNMVETRKGFQIL